EAVQNLLHAPKAQTHLPEKVPQPRRPAGPDRPGVETPGSTPARPREVAPAQPTEPRPAQPVQVDGRARTAATAALKKPTNSNAYFTRAQLLAQVAREALKWHVSAEEARAATDWILGTSAVVRLGERDHKTYFSTPVVLKVEEKILEYAGQARGNH